MRDATENSTDREKAPKPQSPSTNGLSMTDEPGRVERIDAITFATVEMPESVAFYEALGFTIAFRDTAASFVTLQSGTCFVNLWLIEAEAFPSSWWGRTIFHVDDVDDMYRRAVSAGLSPGDEPKDAPWGERFFPIQDPSGHDLSFAKKLTS